ncbi:MAG TPA: hypothetical protein VL240_14450 [Candidatus Binatia bacterium]|nr:hypothetical protein [Candidatus Binatia bacterium]
MKLRLCAIVFALATASTAGAQNPAPTPGQNPESPSAASAPAAQQATTQQAVIPLELTRSLDSRKLKQGDPVQAKTTAELRTGGTLIPRGAQVLGHVTQASARAKGDPNSTLGIAFDSIALKKGSNVPLKAAIQAVAAPSANTESAMQTEGGPSGGPLSGPPGGINAGAGQGPLGRSAPAGNPPGSSTAGMPGGATQPVGQNSSLTAQSTGVVGISNLQLTPDSLLISSSKDVKLAAGTQILLRVQAQ